MYFSIDFKEIEALILAKTGLEITLKAYNNELTLQPRNMGFVQNRVKVRIKIDETYMVPNRLKLQVSAGVFTNLVVPKIMAMLDYLPEGSVARQNDGVVYLMLDKIPQLETFCSNCRIDRIDFDGNFKRISIDAVFSEKSGINVNDIPPAIEDSWSSSTSLKDREIGNTFIGLARAVFESDKIDEVVQQTKAEAENPEAVTVDDLKSAAISFLKNKWASIKADVEAVKDDNDSEDTATADLTNR